MVQWPDMTFEIKNIKRGPNDLPSVYVLDACILVKRSVYCLRRRCYGNVLIRMRGLPFDACNLGHTTQFNVIINFASKQTTFALPFFARPLALPIFC